MKKFLSVVFAVVLVSTFSLSAQPRIGIVAGYDFQFRNNSTGKISSYFHGGYVGARSFFRFSNVVGLSTGLQYKGSFSNESAAYYNLQKGDVFFAEHSIELPVAFSVRMALNNKVKFTIDAGPTGSFGFASTMKPNVSVLKYEKDVTYDNYENGTCQRWNLFVGGDLGLIFSERLHLKAGYRYGTINVGNSDAKVTIQSVGLGLFYSIKTF